MLSTVTREWRRWYSLGPRGDSRNPPWRKSFMPRSADLHTSHVTKSCDWLCDSSSAVVSDVNVNAI